MSANNLTYADYEHNAKLYLTFRRIYIFMTIATYLLLSILAFSSVFFCIMGVVGIICEWDIVQISQIFQTPPFRLIWYGVVFLLFVSVCLSAVWLHHCFLPYSEGKHSRFIGVSQDIIFGKVGIKCKTLEQILSPDEYLS